jgi:hypothetical protein
VTADPVVVRELKSLQEEVAAPNRSGPSPLGDQVSGSNGAPVASPQEASEEPEDRGAFAELASAIKEFVDAADSGIAAHPAANMIGALVAGILIGRLLGRR